jgi:hypothetical protein
MVAPSGAGFTKARGLPLSRRVADRIGRRREGVGLYGLPGGVAWEISAG